MLNNEKFKNYTTIFSIKNLYFHFVMTRKWMLWRMCTNPFYDCYWLYLESKLNGYTLSRWSYHYHLLKFTSIPTPVRWQVKMWEVYLLHPVFKSIFKCFWVILSYIGHHKSLLCEYVYKKKKKTLNNVILSICKNWKERNMMQKILEKKKKRNVHIWNYFSQILSYFGTVEVN